LPSPAKEVETVDADLVGADEETAAKAARADGVEEAASVPKDFEADVEEADLVVEAVVAAEEVETEDTELVWSGCGNGSRSGLRKALKGYCQI
jgi:3-hydroxyacyl-CoA dehydrogenase